MAYNIASGGENIYKKLYSSVIFKFLLVVS